MKGKYMTWEIMLAVSAKPTQKKDIHAELQETIAERKRIMKKLEDYSRRARVIDLYLSPSTYAA